MTADAQHNLQLAHCHDVGIVGEQQFVKGLDVKVLNRSPALKDFCGSKNRLGGWADIGCRSKVAVPLLSVELIGGGKGFLMWRFLLRCLGQDKNLPLYTSSSGPQNTHLFENFTFSTHFKRRWCRVLTDLEIPFVPLSAPGHVNSAAPIKGTAASAPNLAKPP